MNKAWVIIVIMVISIFAVGLFYVAFTPIGPGGMPKDGYNQSVSSGDEGMCDFDISNKNYISKKVSECAVIKYKCDEGLRPFSNKCGCGCENNKETINTNDNSNAKSYLACGCGCCGGEENSNTECLYRSKGDNLSEIIKQDKESLGNTNCSLMGCSKGTLYKYCD